MSGVDIRRVAFGSPDAQALVAEVQAEYVVRYGGPDETPLEADAFEAPSGAFFVGYVGQVPVATGGWRFRSETFALGGHAAEVKRMYVARDFRRRGLARVMLAHLEDTALAAGAGTMVLETGLRQPEAIGLYESAGYLPVERFGHYACSPTSRYYGKVLVTRAAG
ncbi:MAG: GNAT family N-acetyltransferase [Nocardioidaceae bacterium]